MKDCPLTNKLCGTGNLLLRITLAVAIWPHGAQKILGWFGGAGFDGTYQMFTEGMGIWGPLAVVAMLTEFLAPLFLLGGLLTRLTAFVLAVNMFVAMTYHWQNGFFANWAGDKAGEGVEYHILFIGAALSLMLLGAGKYSLDHLVIRKICQRKSCSCATHGGEF